VRVHPLHPVSVHAPIACIVLTPLADLIAAATHRADLWIVSAYLSAGAVVFGLIAATFGALDFERAFAKAPKTVIWHAALMTASVSAAAVSALGRFGENFAVQSPPQLWSIAAGVAGFLIAGVGGALGGELVYRHGVNVER